MKYNLFGIKASEKWNQLSITTKFAFAFGFLLFLTVLVGSVGYVSLKIVVRQTETAIINSAEIGRMVLRMESSMEGARRLQREYFLQFSTFGFQQNEKDLVHQVQNHIDKTVAISQHLKKIIEKSDVSEALQKSKLNITFYFSAANRYKQTFEETISLADKLSNPHYGLKSKLEEVVDELHSIIIKSQDLTVVNRFHSMLLFEKEYWLKRKRFHMQSAFNVIFEINKKIPKIKRLSPGEKRRLIDLFEEYQYLANQILDLDVAIISRFNEFELQIQALDPISAELVTLANKEVESARFNIQNTNKLAVSIFAVTAIIGLLLTILIAFVLNKSITKNLVRLTAAAGKIESGDLKSTIEIDSKDELGKLAETFNSMSGKLDSMVSNLEQEVELRTKHLAKAKEEAEFANSAKSEFLANISHELRNPMHHILSYSRYGVDKFKTATSDKLLHYFRQILKSANRLMTLLNNLLDLSKMEAGKMEYNFTRQNLWQVISEAVEEYQQLMDEKELTVEYSAEDRGIVIVCDQFKIGQVVRNLMSNAIKFTPEGKKIKVSMAREDANNNIPDDREVRVSIRDEGVGIPDDEILTIFEKFTQSSKTKTGAGGTGLGLAISFEIIKAHNGKIWVENNPDQGSTFSFIIPL